MRLGRVPEKNNGKFQLRWVGGASIGLSFRLFSFSSIIVNTSKCTKFTSKQTTFWEGDRSSKMYFIKLEFSAIYFSFCRYYRFILLFTLKNFSNPKKLSSKPHCFWKLGFWVKSLYPGLPFLSCHPSQKMLSLSRCLCDTFLHSSASYKYHLVR